MILTTTQEIWLLLLV